MISMKHGADLPDGFPECSEKNQLMVVVPGKALYGMRLYERDVNTGATRVVWENKKELFRNYRLDDNPGKARAILFEGSYLLLNYANQTILDISLPDGEQDELALPDMKQQLPLYDWMKPNGIVDVRDPSKNFGMKFTGFDIVGGMVYLSLDGCTYCTLCFPIDEPEKFTYLPMNSCSTVQDDLRGGMLTSLNMRVFSCPGTVSGKNETAIYEIKADGNLVKMISNAGGEVSLINKGASWWRLGNTVYITFGEVKDFFPVKGGVYLLTGTGLYLVPQDWESKVRALAEIEQFRIARLKRL